MDIDEKVSQRKRAHKPVQDLSFILFAINDSQLRPDQAVYIFFSDRFRNNFRFFFLTRLVIVKRVNKLLVRSAILDFVDSAVKGVIIDLCERFLPKSVSVDYLEKVCLFLF
jgi:hypothetical protein